MPRKKQGAPELPEVRKAPEPTSEGMQVSMPHADITEKVAARADNPDGRATGTATVTVALNYTTGIIMQGYAMEEQQETTPMGFRPIKKAVNVGDPVTINGTRGHRGSTRIEIVNGFALTQGVPKELWDNWLEANRKSAMVLNGLIFAHENVERVRDECRERKGLRSGLEPLTAPTGAPGEKRDARIETSVNQYRRDDAA